MDKTEILRIKRMLINVGQQEMADELFYTKQTISSMEQGKHLNDRNFNAYNNALNQRIERHLEKEKFLQIVEILERA